jgi:hypothetical protein
MFIWCQMGKLKMRIRPRDITINIAKDAPIPECPIRGERFCFSQSTWEEKKKVIGNFLRTRYRSAILSMVIIMYMIVCIYVCDVKYIVLYLGQKGKVYFIYFFVYFKFWNL